MSVENERSLPEGGDKVRLICISSNTPEDERKSFWKETVGTLIISIDLEYGLIIERDDPKLPRFFQTSSIPKIDRAADDKFTIHTRNSVYELSYAD